MSYEIEGKLIVIEETQAYGSNNFLKRNCVIDTGGDYPQKIQIEFVQDKADILDKYNLGDKVKIGINIQGREWTNPEGIVKYFNSLQGWRIEKIEASPEAKKEQPKKSTSKEDEDDLPF